jgi:Holliday junction resolvasome, DNA-binding subunit
MIASLRGQLLEKTAGTCVIEAAGVGYLVQVSCHTASNLPPEGREVSLRTRQIVREDAVQLFGFADAEELELFDLMIAVSGVGPSWRWRCCRDCARRRCAVPSARSRSRS